MFPNGLFCFTSIKPFLANSNEATKLDDKIDLLIILLLFIFGITFKENCPDMRNTKVVNIVDNLLKHNCDVIVTDPYANQIEVKEKYNIDLITKDKIKNVDAVILALAHKEYKNITLSQWENIFNGNGIIVDVKSFFDKDYFNTSKITHWRL